MVWLVGLSFSRIILNLSFFSLRMRSSATAMLLSGGMALFLRLEISFLLFDGELLVLSQRFIPKASTMVARMQEEVEESKNLAM